MEIENYFYNCSKEYISAIDAQLYDEVTNIIRALVKREKQVEVNRDFFWLLANKGWSYDSKPSDLTNSPPNDLTIDDEKILPIAKKNDRLLCLSSTTLDAKWHADFAKSFDNKLVQIEVQFGKVESMFKDFCGFKIADYENRLALGIEIVLSNPNEYFSHRKSSISGMAYFEIAQKALALV